MNYTVCLDATTIGFDINNLSGNGFSIYTNIDGFITPIAQNVPSSELFAPPLGECPFTITNVPSGSTQLLIIDQCNSTVSSSVSINFSASISSATSSFIDTTCCYSLIDIEPCNTGSNSWCNECNIGFNTISTSPVGRIIAGDLQSSCGTVTDYVIGWYRNNDYSSPEILTGVGTSFSYEFTHPLDSSTGPLVLDGNYEGIIHDIIIDGVQYSNYESGSGVGQPIPFESCFETVVVAPFNCANGTFPLPYTHQISLTAAGNNLVSPPVAATYTLSSSTDYFAYRFDPFEQVADELEIKFISGDPSSTSNPTLYSEPIYLEKIQAGNGAGDNLTSEANVNNNTYPKARSKTIKRVLTLTGSLERTNGDKLEIKVSPLGAQTSWQLKMQCLDEFDCNHCYFDDSPPRKIQTITLNRNTSSLDDPGCPNSTGSCATQKIQLQVSGCFTDDTGLFGTGSYIFDGPSYGVVSSPTTVNLPVNGVDMSNKFTVSGFVPIQPIMANTNCDTIEPGWSGSIEKYNSVENGVSTTGLPLGAISMSFNNSDFYNHYKDSLTTVEETYITTYGNITTDCNDINYYLFYELKIPNPGDPNIPCGDGVATKTYQIHRTAYPDIEFDDTNYKIHIPMPEVENCYTCSSDITCCNLTQLCNYVDIVNNNNFNSVTNQAFIETYQGSRFTIPFGTKKPKVETGDITPNFTSSQWHGIRVISIPKYSMETLPFQPTPGGDWVNYPNLSASVCPNYTSSSFPNGVNNGNFFSYEGVLYGYQIIFPNLTSSLSNAMNNDFEIYARVGSNSGILSQSIQDNPSAPLLIYEYSSSTATVHNAAFFEGGSPTLVIEPF